MINLCLCFGDMKVFGDSESLNFIKELIESHTAIESSKMLIGDIDISAINILLDEYCAWNEDREDVYMHTDAAEDFVKFICRKQVSNPDQSLVIKPIGD